MTMQWVFIRAQDAWMFRDSKPFSAGSDFYARSLFPPHPGTMQGVIRTHYLESNGVDLHAFGRGEITTPVGTPAGLADFELQGPFLSRLNGDRIERLVRTPFDVLRDETRTHYRIMRPQADLTFATGDVSPYWRPLGIPAAEDVTGFEDAGGWLTETGLAAYLNGQILPDEIVPAEQLFAYEDRVGLAVNVSRRTNEPSHFYRAQFIRPRDDQPAQGEVGLLVGMSYPIFKVDSGMIRIGGEGRSGTYTVVDYRPPAAPGGRRLKVVLLTPAYFAEGSAPSDSGWSQWAGASTRLIAMNVGKPLTISGWDLVKRRPKSLRHLVPAGSVYYLESDSVMSIQQPVTDTPSGEPDYRQMGFGAVAIGTWDYL